MKINNKKYKTIIINIFSFFILFCLFIYLAVNFRYSYIQNDDIVDLFVHHINFYHGRFITELFSIFIVKNLPLSLNIHPQNFYIFSSQIIKTTIFLTLIYLMSISFYKFKEKTFYFAPMCILSFFTTMSFIANINYKSCFDTYQFFMGYIFPLVCFCIFWYKLSDFYILNRTFTKKEIFYFFLLSILMSMGNEQINIVTIILLLILFINSLIQKYYYKEKNINLLYLLFPLILCIITSIFVYSSNGFQEIYNGYNLEISLNFSKKELLDFIYVFYKKLIEDNLFLIIPSIFTIFTIIGSKENTEIKQKLINFVLYSYTSFLIFFTSLYFLGPTFDYRSDANYNILPRYWILYPSLLYSFKIFLYIINFYLLGFLVKISTNKKINTILAFCIILPCLIYIKNEYKPINLSNIEDRRVMYIADKIAVYYFEKGQTAILPKEEIHVIIPTINDLLPYDLESNNYIGKIYYYDNYPHYLNYLSIVYNVDVSKGMSFKTEKEALSDFYKNGGSFEEEELKRLDFSNIGNRYKK